MSERTVPDPNIPREYMADTCEHCGAPRKEFGAAADKDGWICSRCDHYMGNGCGENEPLPLGWVEIDERA